MQKQNDNGEHDNNTGAPHDDNGARNDDIDASKAPLLDHLAELRMRLIYAFAAFGFAFALCFAFARDIYNILFAPYVHVVGPENAKAIFTHLLEKFFVDIKLAMYGAAFIALPIFMLQIYKFVAPGLYKNERNAFFPYVAATPILFWLGAAMVYFVVMPLIVNFSTSFEQDAGAGAAQIDLMPKVSEYLALIMQLTIGFGICFQLPVVLTLLARAGFVTAAKLRKFRKYAVVPILAAAAILTPPDIISMVIMAVPTYLLYELSIFVVARVERASDAPSTP